MQPEPSPAPALGPVVRTFRPTRINLAAGGVLGLLLLAGGCALVARAPLQDPGAGTFLYVLGAACVTGGLMFLGFAVRLAYTRVELCEAGFRHHSLAGINNVTWDEVDRIQLHVAAADRAHADPSVTILTGRGRAYRFTANHVTRMAAFVKTLDELTSGYDELWEVTSGAGRRRSAAIMVVCGLFIMVMAPVTFRDIDRAERTAGAEPVNLHEAVYLLYQAGGKWSAAVGMFLIGLACHGWGLIDLGRVNPPARIRRKKKRPWHTAEAEPGRVSPVGERPGGGG